MKSFIGFTRTRTHEPTYASCEQKRQETEEKIQVETNSVISEYVEQELLFNTRFRVSIHSNQLQIKCVSCFCFDCYLSFQCLAVICFFFDSLSQLLFSFRFRLPLYLTNSRLFVFQQRLRSHSYRIQRFSRFLLVCRSYFLYGNIKPLLAR